MTATLVQFEHLFEPKIIRRGKTYQKDGLVTSLKYTNHQWTAKVLGTRPYQVRITLTPMDNQEYAISEMSCTCEYWDNCKHMVAVLYQLQNMNMDNTVSISQNNYEEFKQQINLLSTQQLKEFILRLAYQDSSIIEEWYLWLNHQNHLNNIDNNKDNNMPLPNVAETQIIPIIHQRIQDILEQKIIISCDEEYYYDEWYFDEEVELFNDLCQEFKYQPNLLIEVVFYWIEQCLEYFVEFYSKELQESFEMGLAYIGQILFDNQHYVIDWENIQDNTLNMENISDNYHKNIIERLDGVLDDGRIDEDNGLMLVVARFKFDILWAMSEDKQNALNFLDTILILLQNDNYWLERLLLFKANCLTYLNQTDTLLQLLTKYNHMPAIREFLVHQALEKDDGHQAILLIQEGIKIATQLHHRGTVHKWQVMLLQIAEQYHHQELIRQISQTLAFKDYLIDIEYFKKYKATFSDDEWQMICQEYSQTGQQAIQQATGLDKQNKVTQLAQFYDLENQEVSLVQLIQCYPNMELLNNYRDRIIKYAHEWFGQAFIQLLQDKIGNLSERKAYRLFCVQIQSFVKKYPSIKSLVQTQVNEWMAYYQKTPHRRPALVDELSRIKWHLA